MRVGPGSWWGLYGRSRVGLLLLLVAACDGGVSEPQVADPADLTRAAVERDLHELASSRILEAVRADAVRAVELLCWEVRELPSREAPSDLALIWIEFVKDGVDRFALGQTFRHREGSSVRWQWFVVRDPAWLELRLFDVRPNAAEVDAFLRHWDFETEGRNGRLLGGVCTPATWEVALGRTAPEYPPGTPLPDELK